MRRGNLTLALTFILCLTAAEAPAQKRELPPYPERVLLWDEGKPFADSFITDGASIRLIKDDDLTVAVYGYLEKDFVVVEVTVANKTDKRITVEPSDFFLTYRDKGEKFGYVYALKPSKVADKYRGRAKWGNFFRAFAAGMATTTATSQESGTVNVYGNGGSATGVYNSTTTTTTPDIAARRRAAAVNRAANESAAAAADQVMSRALLANTVFPQTYVSGLVYFERKKFEVCNLFMVIDGTAYSFLFGGTRK